MSIYTQMSLTVLLQSFIEAHKKWNQSKPGSEIKADCMGLMEGLEHRISQPSQPSQPVQWLKIDENTIISVDGRSEVFWGVDGTLGALQISLTNSHDCGHIVPPRYAQRVWEYYCGLALDLTQAEAPLTQAMTDPLDSCPRCGSILIESVGSGLRCEVCLSTVSDAEAHGEKP